MTIDQLAPATLHAERVISSHLDALFPVLDALRSEIPRLASWGTQLAERLSAGACLFAAGNGGSAAEAQHLTAELVGRFDGDRRPFAALALHGDSSAVTAISNDYGFDEVYARQVRGHARPGDILLLLSTSGMSRNLVRAAEEARLAGATTWALTGSGPNPLSEVCDDRVSLPGPSASVQEAQLIAVHAICRAFEASLLDDGSTGRATSRAAAFGSAPGTLGGAR